MSSIGAINGLLISNDYIDVISNNIANASTVGYKSRTPVFFDIFSPLCYSTNTNGNGVGISNVIQNFNNGTLIETGRDLDLGISEEGFFRMLDLQGNVYYTRNGQFLIDNDKNIVNMQGMYLTGTNRTYSKNTVYHPSILEPINLQHASLLQKKPTSEITLKAILKRDPNSITKTDSIDDNLPTSEDYSSYINIFNKDGKKEPINILFKKEDKHAWKVIVELEKSNDSSDKESTKKIFDIEFNSHGELISNTVLDLQSQDSKHENITLDLTGSIEQADEDHHFDEYVQNGYSQSILKTFNIASNGEIIGQYSNSEQKSIGRVLLSKFFSPEKLQPASGNVWSATSESGTESIGVASSTGFGSLIEKNLEASNVDLNKELINMIIAQRNYQSNAQSFKTEDKIINTLINLR